MQGYRSVEGVEAGVVGIVIADQSALFEVEGGWGRVGEDQGLDGETRAVDAVLRYPWECDVDAGAWGQNPGSFLFVFSVFVLLWFFGHCRWVLGSLGELRSTYRHRTMIRVEQMKTIRWSHQNRR